MNAHYSRIAERAGHRCEYCNAPEVIFNFPFEVEHVIPIAKGGADNEQNMALSCRSCNLFKSDCLMGTNPVTNEVSSLFHPRRDQWDGHFSLNLETGAMEGLTSTGQATIAQLRMNSPPQIAARRVWIRLGLIP